MPARPTSPAEWSSRLEPPRRWEDLVRRPDDPRLGEVIESWRGDGDAFRPCRAVLVGFPQDEGVLRNHGRTGAADAPHEIRRWLYRLTSWDGAADIDLTGQPPLDAGNVRIAGNLEETQEALGTVTGAILERGAVPVVLGGGHETAYGHYQGYAAAGRPVGIINLDAQIDLRPIPAGGGTSGTPFRQALEHPTHPLPGTRYVCLGAQPHAVSHEHYRYARHKGCVVRWLGEIEADPEAAFSHERDRLAAAGCQVYVTLDADVVRAADVPGVSAPNADGLPGRRALALARLAGRSPQVSSFDLVEINPRHDRDGQSARWGALVVWHFLMGLASRPRLVNAVSPSP
jgi:formiminoglutamase